MDGSDEGSHCRGKSWSTSAVPSEHSVLSAELLQGQPIIEMLPSLCMEWPLENDANKGSFGLELAQEPSGLLSMWAGQIHLAFCGDVHKSDCLQILVSYL